MDQKIIENNNITLPPRNSSLVNEKLTVVALRQLAGEMSGYPFIKVVFDIENGNVHFINDHVYKFHADYIAENCLNMRAKKLREKIDDYNKSFYLSPEGERRFYLGILAFHETSKRKFFTLETVEVDNMTSGMLKLFYFSIKEQLTLDYPLYLKPANHLQEKCIREIDPVTVPRIFNHELLSSKTFIPLNEGETKGRIRTFASYEEYKENKETIEWHDIIVMDKVPDSIPRVAGIINSKHTTPLSHTNVLAHGWQIPNAIQLGILQDIQDMRLDGKWVTYKVVGHTGQVFLEEIKRPKDSFEEPTWKVNQVKLKAPISKNQHIVNLNQLRMTDTTKYGTKSANLGELQRILIKGSNRLDGFYRIERPMRPNLFGYLAELLKVEQDSDFNKEALKLLRENIVIPRGMAIPFSFQQEFLQQSPLIQQQIGRLKMALELNVKEINSICVRLQRMIKKTQMTPKMESIIKEAIDLYLPGVKSFVVRSSSNAEDLEGFSAAGIYDSKNHVKTIAQIFKAIKQVWASLVSTRSVRLRQEVGISLDDTFMGVCIQEQVDAFMGGVLVTTNPMNPTSDIRNVYINASTKSVVEVVDGTDLPYQFLYNTMEGGGRTLALGSNKEDLPQKYKDKLQTLAIIGRFLQSHFSPDYTFSVPVDIEWAMNEDKIYILQLRPYASS